jgi:WD40 repeat protein
MFEHQRDNNYAVTVLDLATRRRVREITVESDSRYAAFSPDGKTLAVKFHPNDERKGVHLLSLETGKTIRVFSEVVEAAGMEFSPDGKTLAVKENAVVTFWDIASGKRLQRFAALEGYSDTMAFSPDGKRFAARAGYGGIQVLATASGERLALHQTPGDLGAESLAFTPDGDLIAAGYQGHIAWVCKPGKQPPPLAGGHHHSIHALAFEDDGRRLLSSDTDSNTINDCFRLIDVPGHQFTAMDGGSNCTEWNLATGKVKSRLAGDGERPAGREVCYNLVWGNQVGVHAIHVWDRETTRELARVHFSGCDRAQAALSPDGRLVAVSTRGDRQEKPTKGDELRVWNLNTNKQVWRAATLDGWHETLQWSPDGRTLAAHAGGAMIKLWDADKGRVRRTLTLAKDERAGPMVFSPDPDAVCERGRSERYARHSPVGHDDRRAGGVTRRVPLRQPRDRSGPVAGRQDACLRTRGRPHPAVGPRGSCQGRSRRPADDVHAAPRAAGAARAGAVDSHRRPAAGRGRPAAA